MLSFGENLVGIRKSKGFSQKSLAEALGITPTRLNYWEKNKRFPDLDMIKQIALVLGEPVVALVSWDDPEYNKALAKEVSKYDSFEQFLSSIGCSIQTTVVKWHWETENHEVQIPDESAFAITSGESGKTFLFNQDEFDRFQKSIEAAVEYELFKARKRTG